MFYIFFIDFVFGGGFTSSQLIVLLLQYISLVHLLIGCFRCLGILCLLMSIFCRVTDESLVLRVFYLTYR